jgi:hypothetical protein
MGLMIGLKSILGCERLPLFGRYGYVEMIKCLMTNLLLYCRLSIGYQYSPFMVISTKGEKSRPVYGGMFTVGSYGERCFFLAWLAA